MRKFDPSIISAYRCRQCGDYYLENDDFEMVHHFLMKNLKIADPIVSLNIGTETAFTWWCPVEACITDRLSNGYYARTGTPKQ